MKPRLAIALLPLVLAAAPPGAGLSPPDDAGRWRARLESDRARALARLAPARDLIGGATLEEAVVAAALGAGVMARIMPVGTSPVDAGGPAPLRLPVAQLQGAIAAAETVAGAGASRLELASGLRTLARTIDRQLPALAAAAADAGGRGAGCDLADRAPALCIAGTAANTITGDYALVIDLGGDDIHRHAAGGADAQGNGLPVSVTIDVSGSDRYETTVPSAGGARAVQGGGVGGGVGVLVDHLGRDTYRAIAEAPGRSALGQGLGSAGAGLLADLGGNDDYALEERTPGVVASLTQRMTAAGQGWGELGGIGVLLDASGDDAAVVRSAPPGVPTVAVRHAGGFGGGEQGGIGLHADLGGTDSFLLEALDGTSATGYGASARGFGFGFQGAGIEVGGLGDTERIARVRNEVEGQAADSAAMFAIGTASQAGFGGLHDAGGNDRYVSDFASISRSDDTAADGCACQGASADATAGGGQTLAIAAGQTGTAVLEDLQGNDRYETSSTTLAQATTSDDRAQPGDDFAPPSATATTFVAGGSFAPPSSQMVTQGAGIAGLGLLLDGAGNDTYDVDLRVESIAEVTGPMHVPPADHEDETAGPTATATTGELDVYMQAVGQVGGVGAIEDGAGNDAYDISLRMAVSASATDRRDVTSSDGYAVTALARMSNGYHDIYGQGIGVVGGAGFLHDELGDDEYRIDHRLASSAAVDAPDRVVADAQARSGVSARVEGLGAGALGSYGELVDHGGTDRYTCGASSTAQAVPGGNFEDGVGECQVLGGGVGVGWFEDVEGGAPDVITLSPTYPATQGTRGVGVWAGPGGAAGMNA